jgi:hypothetical protein
MKHVHVLHIIFRNIITIIVTDLFLIMFLNVVK